jgi:TPP-dependent pyruvate/acetoin dehydrogenase alpha subunit
MEVLSTRDYERYRSAIEAANDSKDKEALRQIQKQLIAKFGLDNEDVKQLLKKFRFTV